MNESTDWWEYTILGIQIGRLLLLILASLAGYIVGKLVGGIFSAWEKRTDAEKRPILRNILDSLASTIAPLFLVYGLQFGLAMLSLEPAVFDALNTALSVLGVLAMGWIIFGLVDVPYLLFQRWSVKQQSKMTEMLAPMLRSTLRVIVIVLILVQVAQVISHQPITSIIAGLGIGGLAFALAAQDSIKHFFGSVVLIMDRPFEIGERIQVDGFDGPIEAVGFRSTRLRTLDGHLVTIPNGELANKAVRNVSKRPNLRRILNVTITYDTSPEKIQEAVQILKDILMSEERMAQYPADMPPRVYFNEFNADSLNIFCIYWFNSTDWWAYNDFSQAINEEIFARFGAAKIEFAFPTQTLYLAGDPERPLNVGLTGPGQLPPSAS